MTVELRVLGHVEVRVDRRQIEVGHAKQRCVLAALLVDAGNVVTVDQLIDRLWAEQPPQQARPVIRGYLSRLRLAIASAGLGIERRHSGYVLAVDQDKVDVHRFRRLVAEAHAETDEQRALAVLEAALALWRGEAFAGLDTPWINAVRESLAQERFAAEADRIDLALRQGHHAALLAELLTRADVHPLDERLAGQLMLALYRCGRAADALERYQQMRRRLRDEQGTDPSPPLQEVYQRILTTDPALTHTLPVPVSRNTPVPRQLPPPPRLFSGRIRELAELDKAVDADAKAVVISAIGGIGGVGKTWLALHWAHHNTDRFPDGQLYVNLRGFDPAGTPTPPAVALRNFLDALGVAPTTMPVDLDAQVGLYRSLIAGKRMLVLLDNARDTDQVLPLLPGTPTCAVVVTSRNQLGGLVATHAVFPLQLDVLEATEARDVLVARLGADRIAAEPEAVAELLDHCAGLPLAISILAARAALRPAWPLRALAEELHDAATRLDALDAGELTANLRAVFSWSSRALDDDTASLFELLGLAPGPDISLHATTALAALPTNQARVLLHNLENAHLVQQHQPGRYRMHDLVRLHAADQTHHPHDGQEPAARGDGGAEPYAAVTRLLTWYLRQADAAAKLLYPQVLRLPLPPTDEQSTPAGLDAPAAALIWLDSEQTNLVAAAQHAAAQGPRPQAWLLADTLRGYFWLRRHTAEWLAVAIAGRAAAVEEADPHAQAATELSLADAYQSVSQFTQAVAHYTTALDAAAHAGWAGGQAAILGSLGNTYWEMGELRQAADRHAQALALYRHISSSRGQANALNYLGNVYRDMGRLRDAADHCAQALALYRQLGSPHGEAIALTNLGEIDHELGQLDQATERLTRALTMHREVGDRYGEACALNALAATHRDIGGHHQQAVDLGQTALTVAGEIGDQATQAEALNILGSLHLNRCSPQQANDHHQRALDLARDIGNRRHEAHALIGLSACHGQLGYLAQALQLGRQAVSIAGEAGYRVLEGQACGALAEIHLKLGQPGPAAARARQALDLYHATGHRISLEHIQLILDQAIQQASGA
jgi:DNA-binding SARP family transcriptional activator/tetratricopeptide (TPR) repeat protein